MKYIVNLIKTVRVNLAKIPIKAAWYFKDYKSWIKYNTELLRIEGSVLLDLPMEIKTKLSTEWTMRDDIKHIMVYIPRCKSKVLGSGNTGDRSGRCSRPYMDKIRYGWKCPECNSTIGKHLDIVNDSIIVPERRSSKRKVKCEL